MIILLHSNARKFIKATMDDKVLLLKSDSLTGAFWELAEHFPQELLIWKDQDIHTELANNFEKCFEHELIMTSYAVKSQYIPDQIGYIDQLPFLNPRYDVKYPTWRMSTDIGGIFGKTVLQFKEVFREIIDFGYLLNSIGKTGQQNSLFCYSNPGLAEKRQIKKLKFKGETGSYLVLWDSITKKNGFGSYFSVCGSMKKATCSFYVARF